MKKIIIILGILMAIGCSPQKKGVDGLAGYSTLSHDSYGGRETESHEIITSQQQLESLYKELNIDTVPVVDFTKQNVVALFMGTKNTGGHSISIDKMELSGDTLIVTAKKNSPEGMATMALTQPYFIAAVPKTSKVEVR